MFVFVGVDDVVGIVAVVIYAGDAHFAGVVIVGIIIMIINVVHVIYIVGIDVCIYIAVDVSSSNPIVVVVVDVAGVMMLS